MDGGDWGLLILATVLWAVFNQWNDTRIRRRCNARAGRWGLCLNPVARGGDRCPEHISRRQRSLGP